MAAAEAATTADERWTALAAWYRSAGRALPWRGSPDPWVVLVSEVMLQQTQASRVADRIGGFLAEYPDPASLAHASRRAVLAAWSGLGYNRRAVRLQEAAVLIERDGWPHTSAELRHLPGVGDYTAAAVACFAFGEQIPAVDINVRRVLSRWMGTELNRGEAAGLANDLLPPADEAHQWTQAIMDLGASICTARQPACHRCPCQPWCTGAEIVVSSRPQSRFEGSLRQARGLIVRALSEEGTIDITDLSEDVDMARLDAAAAALESEDLVVRAGNMITLREPLDTGGPDR